MLFADFDYLDLFLPGFRNLKSSWFYLFLYVGSSFAHLSPKLNYSGMDNHWKSPQGLRNHFAADLILGGYFDEYFLEDYLNS